MGFDLKEGTLFAGRYQIVRALGMGAMGAVYEVLHVETERRRALKVMLPMLSNDPALWDRFRQETKVAAHVDSEFIVDVFDAGVEEQTGLPFFVMELLRGEDLERRIERLGPLPPAEVVTYLHQVALALDKTHRASIVHRDLKPENLFLTVREDGQPRIKVLDFGIAKLLAGPNGARATQNLGTPLYMAPEQLSAESGVLSGATDIYGLGMVAYTLLVGKSYWETEAEEGHSLFALLATVSRGPTAPACARAAAIPRASFTRRLIAQATTKKPAQTRIARSSPSALWSTPSDSSPKMEASLLHTPQTPNISAAFDPGAKSATTVRPADCVAPRHRPATVPTSRYTSSARQLPPIARPSPAASAGVW